MVLTGLEASGKAGSMFERFTDRARRVVVLSQEEAGRLHHNYIGTEHVLLGLLGERDGIAARVLASFGMSADGVRREVIERVGEGKYDVTHHIPFTPRAKKILELALREALQLNHNYIGTEHILLGVIREGEGVGAEIVRTYGDLEAIRAAVIAAVPAWTVMEGGRPAALLLRRRRGEQAGGAGDLELTATPAADATLTEAVRLAGVRPVGSHHLLLAALADPESAAAKALAAAGVDLDQAKDALRGADVTGTTDEQPEEAGRRQMNIQVTGELVTVVAADPALVEAGRAAILALTTQGTQGTQGGEGEGGPAGAPGGVIRGADLRGTAATSLSTAWRALRDSLVEVTRASAAERGKPADKPGGKPADQPDDGPDDGPEAKSA
jgi:ATP-dependent Clp protease ATP-binding subunit ClpA